MHSSIRLLALASTICVVPVIALAQLGIDANINLGGVHLGGVNGVDANVHVGLGGAAGGAEAIGVTVPAGAGGRGEAGGAGPAVDAEATVRTPNVGTTADAHVALPRAGANGAGAVIDLTIEGDRAAVAATIGVVLPRRVATDSGTNVPRGDSGGEVPPLNRVNGGGGAGIGDAGGNGAGDRAASAFFVINGGAGGAPGGGVARAAGAGMMTPSAADLAALGMPTNGEVCFFEGAYYTGTAFCVPAGAYSTGLQGGWDDTIASIWVAEGVMVQICTNAALRDKCELVDISVPQLFGSWLDSVSSFVVL